MRSLGWPDLGTVLCLGAHSDDIEIGAGATVLRLVREQPAVRIVWVVLAGLEGGAGAAEVVVREFRDGHFPVQWAEIKAFLETLKPVAPDLVLTHYGKDLHQDHRTVSELTWNTFRDQLILEYEIPKWDGGLGAPNLFVPASVADADAKIAALLDCFPTQAGKHWFDDLTFRGLMRLRGLECNAADGLAEAFYARKVAVA